MAKTSNAPEKIKMAIIGFGGMACGWHYNKMNKTGLYDIVGVYDVDEKRKNEAAIRKLKVYDSLDSLLEEPNLKLVLIATPNDVHEFYAIKILKAGINALCEKPVTLSSKSLQNMIDAAKEGRSLLMVHQNRRWDRDFLKVKSIYDSGDMGGMYKLESNVVSSHGLPGEWRRIKAKGGGILWDWGVHLIDQMLTMNKSKVVGITCRASYIWGFDCDDGIYMTIDFADGFSADINIDTNSFIKRPRWYAFGKLGSAIIKNWNCSGKIVKLKIFDDKKNRGIVAGNGFTKTMAERSRSTIIAKRLPKIKFDPFELYTNLYNCITKNATPIVTNESVMRCMLVMEASFAAIEQKKTIIVNI